MFIKAKAAIIVSAMAIFLTGCETTNSIPYKTSPANTIALQGKLQAKGKKVSVANVIIASSIEEKPNCRMMGPIAIAPGKTVRQFVKEAIQEELLAAGSYDPASPIVIDAEIDELTFSSVSPARWNISIRVRSNKSTGYRVSEEYKFETSWTAQSACKNTADAFGLAVQQLIRKIVEDKKFDELVN
jgi:hypothetical protein